MDSSDRRRYVAKVALVVAAYYGSAKLGLSLAFESGSVTAVWPPAGIALAAVVLWGYRIWPGVALGALLANSWTGVPLHGVLGITVGNTLEALTGAWLLANVASFRPSLERVRDVVALAVAGAVSTTVAATIGVTSLLVADEIASGQFGSVWRTWWLGDLGGDLIVAPALLVAVTWWPFRRTPGRALEALALAATVTGASLAIFASETPRTFLIFPPLIWAALRFWQPGAAFSSLIASAVAVAFTQADVGPFADSSPDDRLLLAQTFVGVAGITSLVLAAVITERRQAEDVAEYIADTLQESLLPAQLPEIPGVQAAADFRPAGERHVVGGDFYDLFQQGDGSWAVVMGDVVGKGAPAAAVTGLARYTLRAAVMQESSPSRVLGFLNDAIRRQRPNEFCSVAFARLETDGARGARAVVSTAGHPLPLVLRSGGVVEQVGAHGTLLGAYPDPDLSDAAVDLFPGDSLVLFTDGLTDAYAPRRIVSAAELDTALLPHAGRSAREITTGVMRTLVGVDGELPRDDIALLVLAVPSVPETPERELVVRLAGEVDAVPAARRALAELAPLLDAELLEKTSLLVSELVTNSIRHAAASAAVQLRVAVYADRVRAEVTDRGPGFEARAQDPGERRESGWGLYLVDQLSDRWGVSRVDGTAAWFEIDRGQGVG